MARELSVRPTTHLFEISGDGHCEWVAPCTKLLQASFVNNGMRFVDDAPTVSSGIEFHRAHICLSHRCRLWR